MEPVWEGYHERRRCSRDTCSQSYMTQCTIMRRSTGTCVYQNRQRGRISLFQFDLFSQICRGWIRFRSKADEFEPLCPSTSTREKSFTPTELRGLMGKSLSLSLPVSIPPSPSLFHCLSHSPVKSTGEKSDRKHPMSRHRKWKRQGHGSYNEIEERDFFQSAHKSSR